MVLIQLAQDGSTWITEILPSSHFWHQMHQLLTHSLLDSSVLAQQLDTDVFADFRNTFNNFIQSGQVWALIIGIILGYFIRSFTSYG